MRVVAIRTAQTLASEVLAVTGEDQVAIRAAHERGGARRIHVIDLDSGDTVRVLPHRDLQLLDSDR